MNQVIEMKACGEWAEQVAGLSVRERSRLDRILRREGVDFSLMPIPRRSLQEAPLSLSQQQAWRREKLRPGDPALRCAAIVSLQGDLDLGWLHRALNQVIGRHETLRTEFDEIAAEPFQRILPHTRMELPRVDLRAIPGHLREGALFNIADRQLRPRVDPASGRPFLALLVMLGHGHHALALSAHRLVWDLESARLLAGELLQLYRRPGRRLEGLPIQYSDFAVWQRRGLRGESLESRRRFWRESLEGLPALLDLPADRSRGSGKEYQSGRIPLGLSPRLSQRIEALAERQGATLFTTLLAAFQVLLSRWSGQGELAVCSLASQRQRAELAPVIGLLDCLIASRCSLSPGMSFARLLDAQRTGLAQALDHLDVPLGDQGGRSGAGLVSECLAQVAFSLQPQTATALQAGGLKWACQAVPPERIPFELALSLRQAASGLEGEFIYASDLFDPSTVRRMAGHLTRLLEGIADNPDQAIDALPLLSPTEEDQILLQWDRTLPTPEAPDCLQDRIEAQAERRSRHAAVSFEGASLSYSDLNSRANQVAHGLAGLGEGRGQLVAVLLESGPRQIIALLGILKAGHAFVCLDPDSPSPRLQAVLDEARPICLISESAGLQGHGDLLRQFCRQGRAAVLDLPSAKLDLGPQSIGSDHFDLCPSSNPRLPIEASSPAYIAYTSGSTGRPKGIVHTHGSVGHFLAWYGPRFGYCADSRVAVWTAITFDPTYCEILAGLQNGATLCLASARTKKDPATMLDWLASEKATLTEVVPSFTRALLPVLKLRARQRGGHPLPDLKRYGFVGEVLPVELVQELQGLFGDSPQLANLYGPTETVMAASYDIPRIGAAQRSIPVGRPLGGSQVLILDEQGQLCPIGVKGEICIRGYTLAEGYHRRPEETSRAFVANPFSDKSPRRIYRSGDLGRWLQDGNIEILGRADHQVKVRGARVELGEVEAVLSRHEAVRQCVVTAVDVGQETLPAHQAGVEKSAETAPALAAVSAVLAGGGASPRGERFAPALFPSTQPWRKQAGWGSLEDLAADAWRDWTGSEKVDGQERFSAQGGNSLLAARIVSRLSASLGCRLPLEALLKAPSLAGWIRSLQEALSRQSSTIEIRRALQEALLAPPSKGRSSGLM